jgi:stage II sporulation protein D
MKNFVYIIIYFYFFNLQLLFSAKVDILIAKSQHKIIIQGHNLEQYQNNKIKYYSGNRAVTINCHRKKYFGKKTKYFASFKSSNKKLFWKNNKYWGKLRVYRNIDGTCDLINTLSLDKYIGLLLTKEVNRNWPIQALKAQAIAARTYALYKIKKRKADQHYDLENSEKDQVYGFVKLLNKNTVQAAVKTSNLVLMSDKNSFDPIFYHSKCGGKTLLPQEVWGGKISSYQSVHCPFCKSHGLKNWNSTIKPKLIKNIFKKQNVYNQSRPLKLISLNDHKYQRVLRLYVNDKFVFLPKPKLRKILGRKLVPSNNFKLSVSNDRISIQGSGYGHGVGLCQYGALELAKRGYNYKQILSHYFPSYHIKKINTSNI